MNVYTIKCDFFVYIVLSDIGISRTFSVSLCISLTFPGQVPTVPTNSTWTRNPGWNRSTWESKVRVSSNNKTHSSSTTTKRKSEELVKVIFSRRPRPTSWPLISTSFLRHLQEETSFQSSYLTKRQPLRPPSLGKGPKPYRNSDQKLRHSITLRSFVYNSRLYLKHSPLNGPSGTRRGRWQSSTPSCPPSRPEFHRRTSYLKRSVYNSFLQTYIYSSRYGYKVLKVNLNPFDKTTTELRWYLLPRLYLYTRFSYCR